MSTIEIQRCWRGRMARSLAKRLRQRDIDYDRRVAMDREMEVAALREQRIKDMVRDRPSSSELHRHRHTHLSSMDGVALAH